MDQHTSSQLEPSRRRIGPTSIGGLHVPHASINGAELFYDQAGSGEPLLMHHGYTGSHDAWWELITPRLQDRFHCIVMDARGAGDSSHPDDGYTIEQYARDVIGMAGHLGLDKFTYCGHSMGGVIGMELGINHADRLERLILVAPAPADGVQAPPEMFERSRRLRQENARDTMIRERTIMAAREGGEEQIARSADRALSVSDGHFEDSWKALADVRLGDRLSEITLPTLMISGAADSLLQANLKDFQRLPNATLHVFSRVGHGVPSDVPDEFAEVVADFMMHGVVTAKTLMDRLQAASAPA
jgi:pimeloyl-ACP methyl ester carboxylesterase